MSVRFSAVTRVSYVPVLPEVPDDVQRALYLTPQDLARIEGEVARSIRAHRTLQRSAGAAAGAAAGGGGGVEEEDDTTTTIRGLEHMKSASEFRRRKAQKERALEAVLDEQERRSSPSSPDPSDDPALAGADALARATAASEALARMYAAATAQAREEAAAKGKEDAEYVRRHVFPPPPTPPPPPAPKEKRPVLEKQSSVAKSVLARLGRALDAEAAAGDPQGGGDLQEAVCRPGPGPGAVPSPTSLSPIPGQGQALNLAAMLERAISIGAELPQALPSTPQQQQQPQPQRRNSRDSSLWASLSGEAAAVASTTRGPSPQLLSAAVAPTSPSPQLSLPQSASSGHVTPTKLPRDVLERISLTLKNENESDLPVAVPLPLSSSLASSSSSSSSQGTNSTLSEVLGRIDTM